MFRDETTHAQCYAQPRGRGHNLWDAAHHNLVITHMQKHLLIFMKLSKGSVT